MKTSLRLMVKVDAATLAPDVSLVPYLNLLQHFILSGLAMRRTDEATGTYTILNYAVMRECIPARVLPKVLKFALAQGLVERDSTYIPGEKSFGYRIGSAFSANPAMYLNCNSKKLNKKYLSKRRKEYRAFITVHKHLLSNLRKLQVQLPEALKRVTEAQRDTTTESMKLAVTMLMNRDFDFKVCDYGRVHTNVTRMISGLRNYLMFQGEHLISLDVTNSQPLFLYLAFVNYNQPSNNKKLILPSSRPSHMKCIRFPEAGGNTVKQGISEVKPPCQNDDIIRYKDLCETGALYPYLMERIGFKVTENYEAKKDIFKNRELFPFLYGNNRNRDAKGNLCLRLLPVIFQREFPTLWAWIRSFKKENGYQALSRAMQRAESTLIIETVCHRIMNELPSAPLLTIHDSLFTTAPFVPRIKEIVTEEFGRLGVKVSLHTTDYRTYRDETRDNGREVESKPAI